MAVPPRTIILQEYHVTCFPPADLSVEDGTALWQVYGIERGVVDVTFPSPRTNGTWQITAGGWAGHIPLTPSLDILIEPRMSPASLFRLLAYTYGLDNIDFLAGLVPSDSVRDVFEQLALLLAKAVLARQRRGLYRSYAPRTETLPYVRGRIIVRPERAGQPQLVSHYEEHTADVAANQLLAWTLRRIAHSRLCREPAQNVVRRAYHGLARISAIPVPDDALEHLHYSAHNKDYAPLHALCRFFLTNSGPGHHTGARQMVPFLVDMARLHEQYVARSLQRNLASPWRLRVQERVEARGHTPLAFTVDMVIYRGDGRPIMVLDTKYKDDVAASDIQQIVTYAQLLHCREAVLVYPQTPRRSLDVQIGDVHVRALPFGLDPVGDAEGVAFLQALGFPTADTIPADPL